MMLLAALFSSASVFPGFALRHYRTLRQERTRTHPQSDEMTYDSTIALSADIIVQAPAKLPFAQLPLWVRVPSPVWLTPGLALIFAQMFDRNFLPSEHWVSSVGEHAIDSVELMAVAFDCLIIDGERQKRNPKPAIPEVS